MTARTGDTVAAFDFDGTLTRRDSLLPFLRHYVGTARFLAMMAAMSPVLAAYLLRAMRNDRAKEAVLRRFLGGEALADVDAAGESFALRRLPALLRAEAFERFTWHKAQGHTCILVSASLIHYLRPWSRRVGFDHVIASRLEIDADRRVTGRLVEGNCYGAEKARRLRSLLATMATRTLFAYGDSRGDREMLELADHSYYRSMPRVQPE
jgi:HAD superfamily hydrolase (TIGR01490 family)